MKFIVALPAALALGVGLMLAVSVDEAYASDTSSKYYGRQGALRAQPMFSSAQ